jgi:hypothetical protein
MTSSKGPSHVVVDGSNIATEGRSLPSLAQLNEAVMAFMEEYPNTSITVVVDATFGHRIDKSEAKEFEEGISNNELVAPPAGAVGRGDAFVLSIAQKANASILSNDSFQEFHGDYDWLFDDGRLIGGKPVPHVGWVFVDRLPVRGPVSRKATGSSRGGGRRTSKKESDKGRTSRKVSPEAMEPMPVPKSPPPGRKKSEEGAPSEPSSQQDTGGGRRERVPKAGETVNELMPFLEFVEHHPVGTSVNGTVESYSSHGAYISIGENGVRGYVPLRLMADPPPTSARKVMKIGESVTLVVVSFAPLRRSIDCALPDMAETAIADAKAQQAAEAAAELEAETGGTRKASTKRAAKKAPATKAAKRPAGKAAAETPTAEQPSEDSRPTADEAAADKRPVRKAAAGRAPARKAAAGKAAAEKAPATKAPAKKAPAKKAAAKSVVPETAPAKKTPPKKAPAEKTVAKRTPAKKAPTKKTAGTKTAAKKTPAKKVPAKKVPAKKAAAKKSPAKKATPSAGQGG